MTKVLVIDDDPHIRTSLTDLLQSEYYEVSDADNGRSGLEHAQRLLPDIILCDIRLPELDGYEVLKRVRSNPHTSTIPFIFLSASNEIKHIRQGMKLGADDYIPKPFDPMELLEAMRVRLRFRAQLETQHESTLKLLRKSLIYALPHEFRTPLMQILGYADLLAEGYDSVTSENIREWSNAIIESGQRLHKLAENYLILVQIELALSDPEQTALLRNCIVPYPIEVIETQACLIARQAERLDDLQVELQNTAIQITGEDLTKITQELVENAFKFSEPGTKVEVRSRRTDNKFILSILDRGRGMSPEQIKGVGEYMQFERAVYEQQGIGLGLAVARRLVQLHNGQLTIRSEPGQGTLVMVTFPL